MKFLFGIILFATASIAVNAQTPAGTSTSSQKKTQTTKRAAVQQQKGSGQYHGNRDTTPGSPMGTGGAGGDMSGSPAASAIETDDQTSKAQVPKDTSASTEASGIKKTVNKKSRTTHRKTRSGF